MCYQNRLFISRILLNCFLALSIYGFLFLLPLGGKTIGLDIKFYALFPVGVAPARI